MSRLRISLLFLVTLLLTLALRAADPPAKPPPIVTVVKTDGTTVKGQFLASSRDAVTLRLINKGVPEGDGVDVPWSAIKSVSNGLTRQKAFDQWKGEHRDQLCADCRGSGQARCVTCKGTGHDPASSKDCQTCKGELLVPCKAPRCDKGQTPCPKPCLKLSDPGWVKRPDGSLWRRWNVRGGYYEFSEHHVGEIPQLGKDGLPTGTIPCPTCGRTGKVDCPTCGGAGNIPCPTCTANTTAPACSAQGCDHGKTNCQTCGGTGLKK